MFGNDNNNDNRSWCLLQQNSDLAQCHSVMGEIKSRFDSIAIWIATKIRFNIARFDSSTMRFDTDSIQILTIRFKIHAIWTEISKSWLKLNTHSYYSLLSQILSSNVWFYPSLMYARNNSLSVIIRGRLWTARSIYVKALLRKWKFQWLPLAGTNKIEICLLKPFCCFGIWDLIWDLPITGATVANDLQQSTNNVFLA